MRFVVLISAPRRQSNKFIMFIARHAYEALEAMAVSFEIVDRDVVVDMRIVMTGLLCLFCGEIAALLVDQRRQRTGSFPIGAGHAQSFKKFEGLCIICTLSANGIWPVQPKSSPMENAIGDRCYHAR